VTTIAHHGPVTVLREKREEDEWTHYTVACECGHRREYAFDNLNPREKALRAMRYHARHCETCSPKAVALKHGFDLWHTGGGCTAYGRTFYEGTGKEEDIMITTAGGSRAPQKMEDVCLASHRLDGGNEYNGIASDRFYRLMNLVAGYIEKNFT